MEARVELTHWLPILPGYLSLRHLRGAQLL